MDMKEFEIWSETFIEIINDKKSSHYHGISYGINFKHACDNLAYRDGLFAEKYDSEEGTIWGLKLYNSKEGAMEKHCK